MMNKDKFFDNHFDFTGIGFGSKAKDDKVAKETKQAVKHGLTKK